MIKITKTYTDYNENERTEDFRFNLTKTELMQMQLSKEGGLENKIQQIINSQDQNQIMEIFKEIIIKSYGVMSDDGKRFQKNDELRQAFIESPAYDMIFMELATNADAATKFIKGVIPKDMDPDTNKSIPAPSVK